MASVDKIDMSLDDIIKLNRKSKLQQKKQATGKRFAIGAYRQLKQFRGRVGKTRLLASRAFTAAKLAGVSPLNRTRKTPRQTSAKFNYQYPSRVQQNFQQHKRQGYFNVKSRQRTGRIQQQQLLTQKKKTQYNISTKRQGNLRRKNFQQGKIQKRYGSLLPRQQTKQKLSWRQTQNTKQQRQQKIRQNWQQNQFTKKWWQVNQANRSRFQQNQATRQMWQQNAKIKQSWLTRKQQKRSRQAQFNDSRGFVQPVTQARPQQSRGWKLSRNYGYMRSDVIVSQQRQQRRQQQQQQQPRQQQRQPRQQQQQQRLPRQQQRQQQQQQRMPRQQQQQQQKRRQWGSTVTNSEGSILKISVVNDPPGYKNSDVQVQLKASRPVEKQQRIQLSRPHRQIETGMSFDERFTMEGGGGGDGTRQVFL